MGVDSGMIDRNVELITMAKVELIKGRVTSDLDSLSKILRDNYHNRFECVYRNNYDDSSYFCVLCTDLLVICYNSRIIFGWLELLLGEILKT